MTVKKYRPAFAKRLRDGIRMTPRRVSKGGRPFWWTVEWLCIDWKITTTTYYRWVKEYTTFKEAHELGEMHYKAVCQDEFDAAMYDKECNGQLMKLKAYTTLGYSDKKIIENKHEEQIQKIQIEVIATPTIKEIQERELKNNIIDITPK